MSNKVVITEVGGWRRKSARILALEEREKERHKSSAASANNTNNIHSSKGKASLTGNVRPFQFQQLQHHGETMQPSPLSPLKRGRKQKRLEDLDVPYLEQSKSQEVQYFLFIFGLFTKTLMHMQKMSMHKYMDILASL